MTQQKLDIIKGALMLGGIILAIMFYPITIILIIIYILIKILH